LHTAEERSDIHFHLVDSRNAARVRYERVNSETGEEVPWDAIVKGYEYSDGSSRVNSETGEEVPWDAIVKGYEYSDGSYVLLSNEELERASVEMTRTIEIERFVDLAAIDVQYFERPYLVAPAKGGEKGYVLLREAAEQKQVAGIATVVIRTRQHLAALIPAGKTLVLELMRYPQELRSPTKLDIPTDDFKKYKVTSAEVELAAQLIDGMRGKWDPREYHDEYRDVLMKLIENKIKKGMTEVIEEVTEEEPEEEPGTINFMDVLKRSVADAIKAKSKRSAPESRKKGTVRKKSGSRSGKRRAS
ncbi:MAG: Ku protein, partial [Pirellulaceae bacterium]